MEDFEILAKCAKDVLKSIWSLENLQESWKSSGKIVAEKEYEFWLDRFFSRRIGQGVRETYAKCSNNFTTFTESGHRSFSLDSRRAP